MLAGETMLLAFLFWLSNGESVIRLQLHSTDDLLVEVPPQQSRDHMRSESLTLQTHDATTCLVG
jgi:hypothetical protein